MNTVPCQPDQAVGGEEMASLTDGNLFEGTSWVPYLTCWLDNQLMTYFPANDTGHQAGGPEARRAKDLLIVVPLILTIGLTRYLLERAVFRPLARWLRIEESEPMPGNVILEKVYKHIAKKPSRPHVASLARQLSWDTPKVKTWFKQRGAQDKPSTQKKFCESMWRCLFYTWAVLYAWNYISKTNWIWDGRECWKDNPSYVISTEEYVHYMVELAFYGSLVFSQFLDIKRKDFLIMFVHHNATILLIAGSYYHNMTRIGALTMLYHDIADIVLEAGKISNYVRCQTLCNALFVVFAVVFMITRLIILPLRCGKPVIFDSEVALAGTGAWKYYTALTILMLALHIYWSLFICSMVVKVYRKGKVTRDDRSDMESSSDDDTDPPEKPPQREGQRGPICYRRR
ncbi:ceramide synthase 6-like isoform X2 [Ascaphus truei]|uniref:ceramide synthase 6-like isoform X2 n=1 Tax=Ascaphus truei TaxID=8439 RepID=UPI003F5950F7